MFSCRDAALIFGKTSARIRQVCSQHQIGYKGTVNGRILFEADMKRLCEIFDRDIDFSSLRS